MPGVKGQVKSILWAITVRKAYVNMMKIVRFKAQWVHFGLTKQEQWKGKGKVHFFCAFIAWWIFPITSSYFILLICLPFSIEWNICEGIKHVWIVLCFIPNALHGSQNTVRSQTNLLTERKEEKKRDKKEGWKEEEKILSLVLIKACYFLIRFNNCVFKNNPLASWVYSNFKHLQN